MHLCCQVTRGRGPVAQRHRYGHHPLACRHPGDDALDQVGRSLGHTPAGTRRTKPAPLATEGQQGLFRTGVTSQAQKAVGEDATLELVVKLALHIRRQAFGIGVVVEREEKRLQVFRNHVVENRAARIPWLGISISNAVLGCRLHPAPLLGEPVVSASTPPARRRKMLSQGAGDGSKRPPAGVSLRVSRGWSARIVLTWPRETPGGTSGIATWGKA